MPRSRSSVVGVHDQRRPPRLVLAEDVALLEQAVHQRRLAVVDVGDDRDVANIVPDRMAQRGRAFRGHLLQTDKPFRLNTSRERLRPPT